MPKQNKGDKGEIQCVKYCFDNQNNLVWCNENLYEPEGIQVINPITKKVINSLDEIQKANSNYKSDIYLKSIRRNEVIGTSIKSFTSNTSPPSVINVTRRSKFIENKTLSNLVQYADIMMKVYFETDKNKSAILRGKSECDIMLSRLDLDEETKNGIAEIIMYFTFNGTGNGDSNSPANAVIDYYGNGKFHYTFCPTRQDKINYVLNNWNRYQIVLRGHCIYKSGKNKGKLRTNGLLKSGPVEDDLPWVCYYEGVDGKKYPRGALGIRIVKDKNKNKKK
tara:strand:+ start:487 stop:1323 length:837 start_codon:yes stop_codon:yes gene_type:complete